jgi:hypothetical protein
MTKKRKKKSGGWYQVQRIALIRLHWFGGMCMWRGCTETKNLEFAHAIPTKLSIEKPSGWRSSYERLKDLTLNPECFLLFCRSHHMKYDDRINEDTWTENYRK